MRHVLIFWGFLLALSACGGQQETEPEMAVPEQPAQAAFRNVAEGVTYVGDAECASCHEDLYRSYQTHGMAQSYYPLTPEHVVEDFNKAAVYHEASNLYYRPYREGDRFYQEEYRLGPDGAKIHRLVREMHYVVGSGAAARTYLTEEAGRLYELPLTWYTQPEKWEFSPGYAVHNGRFDRLIPDQCMACHNSYPETVPFSEGDYRQVPNGIGCERCHGPGDLHVEARLADPEAPGDVDSTIVNPRHLTLERRLDVCQQCHLQGTVSMLREGDGPFSFRPSQVLAAHRSLYVIDEPQSTDQIKVISHAERMQLSACFIETQGQSNAMDCVTCHNPHEGFREAGPAYFNSTCLSCHAPDALQATFQAEDARQIHSATANCITCHMPKVESEDAPHASFTDHWIRVVEDDTPVTPVAAHGPPKLVPYFERDKAGTEAKVYEGMAYIVYGQQEQDSTATAQGIATLQAALSEKPDHGEAQFLLGLAEMRRSNLSKAIPALEESIRLDPGIPERLNALAQAYELDRRDPATIARLYERALAVQPALAEVRLNYGRFLEAQRRLGEAIAQYQQAAEEEPWLARARYNLGTAYLQEGQFSEAENLLKQAVALNPDYAEARGNLGLYYATQGQMDQAREQFEQAVAAAPNNTTALGNLGTFYLNTGNLPRAIDLLQRAVAANPVYLDGLVNLALAHFRNEDVAQARTFADKALAIDPNNAMARQILEAL